ncbi:unnamed protein product [Rhodiola kirilowii]
MSQLCRQVCFVVSTLLFFVACIKADTQADNLRGLLSSKWSKNPPLLQKWADLDHTLENYLVPQGGSMQDDKIVSLPGQPEGVDFDQYAGYVTIDEQVGKALFYYFVESPQDSSTKPLLLWLNGGPGCSSLAFGAMEELGPFRVNSNGGTLFRNPYSWNEVANVLFLESPAGVGFSYSNSSSVYNTTGDVSTANDAYAFVINWLDRYPQYKGRDFYIAGESYAGHYVPQLAYTISLNNKKNTKKTFVNLKGVLIGNGLLNDETDTWGSLDNFWSHNLNSDETFHGLRANCNFSSMLSVTEECIRFYNKAWNEIGDIDIYNIYAPLCFDSALKNGTAGSVDDYDPCSDYYMYAYLNLPEVQTAFHAKVQPWSPCRRYNWTDGPETVLPLISYLISDNIRVWLFSGDMDGILPTLGTRYGINTLHLPVETAWRTWYTNSQVGGYVEAYEGLTFATVRGAGHMVPSYQPERALTLISSFLQGVLPPPK